MWGKNKNKKPPKSAPKPVFFCRDPSQDTPAVHPSKNRPKMAQFAAREPVFCGGGYHPGRLGFAGVGRQAKNGHSVPTVVTHEDNLLDI